MKLLNKVAARLGFVPKAKVNAIVKLKAREFASAAINRLTNDWTTQSTSADSNLRMSLNVMRARSRDLADNNDYAKKYLGMLKSNVLGERGITFKAKAKSPGGALLKRFNAEVEAAWKDWGKRGNCTVCKKWSWKEVQNISLKSVGRDGECLIRMIRPWHGNKYGFALQLIESDLLDLEHNEPPRNGREIRMGVEMNEWGEATAYFLKPNHPNDLFYQDTTPARIRVPATEIVHPYLPERIGQSRGYPWLATPMFRLKMLGGYEEAEVVASRAAASKMAFITSMGEHDYTGEEIHSGKVMDAEPGSIEQLLQGQDIKALDWNHPNSQYGEFMRCCLRGVAAGLEVSYNTLSNDLSSVNFSSARVGLQDERGIWRVLQAWKADHFCSPIYQEWLMWQGLSGNLHFDVGNDLAYECEWHGRRWEWVDPTKDIAAKISELNAGLTSITRVLSERGIDRDELFEEIKGDQDAMATLELNFPELYQAVAEEEGLYAPNTDEEEEEETEESYSLNGAKPTRSL